MFIITLSVDQDESTPFSLFGLEAMGLLGLFSQLISVFYGGIHRWRSDFCVSWYSRYIRILICRFFMDYQQAYVEKDLENFKQEAGYNDSMIC